MSFVIRQLDDPSSLGEKLYAMRKTANYTLREMAEKTRIRKSILQAFEAGNYDALPPPLYARQFLKRYVRALGGDPEYFLRCFEEERGTCDFLGSSQLPLERTRLRSMVTPARLGKLAGAACLLLVMVGYVGWQVRDIVAPPEIFIESPTDGFTTSEAQVVIQGKTDKEVDLSINGERVLLDRDGVFSAEVALERGLNVITIEGAKRYSRTARLFRRIVLSQERQATASPAFSLTP